MPGEIAQHTNCLNLDFFILSGEDVKFDAVEDRHSDLIR